ncbi:flagellar protein FlaG [Massilia sp. R2A-15]|uniref:flagellar protein FlaG n=1 Tax=Massilia sp. R2A-15 TaxID=3064278 RepID=UPI002734D57C|nr:flagellar protein FlaG [Massilia sp. R2A-15]WLI87965.1 flagellar protein FlaG [Massilia sp. R2A-15]
MEIRPIPANAAQTASPAPPEREAPAARQAAIAPDTAVAVTPAAPAAVADAAADALAKAVSHINQSLHLSNQGVEFTVDADSNRTVVKVVDQETKQVLRQMPTQEALDIAKALDRAQGMLIRQEA